MYTLKEGVGGNALSISPNPPSPLIVSTSHPKDTTQEHKKRKHPHSPPHPSSKKQNALDIDIYTYATAGPPPPEGGPPLAGIVKTGACPCNHHFFFLGVGRSLLSRVPLMVGQGTAWHGQSVTVRGWSVYVVRCYLEIVRLFPNLSPHVRRSFT